MDIHGKKIIVTGGVRGLGRAMVSALMEKGANIAVFDIDSDGLEELRSACDGVDCFKCNLADYDEVVAITDQYYKEFGPADEP